MNESLAHDQRDIDRRLRADARASSRPTNRELNMMVEALDDAKESQLPPRHDVQPDDSPRRSARYRRPHRRTILIATAAALALVATVYPVSGLVSDHTTGRSTSNAAFAVDPRPDGTVQVDLTTSELFTPSTSTILEQALQDAGIRAHVMYASPRGTCNTPPIDGLPAMTRFLPNELDQKPTDGVRHFTFRPSAMPDGSYLLVVVAPVGYRPPGSKNMLATSFLLIDGPPPRCVEYNVEEPTTR